MGAAADQSEIDLQSPDHHRQENGATPETRLPDQKAEAAAEVAAAEAAAGGTRTAPTPSPTRPRSAASVTGQNS